MIQIEHLRLRLPAGFEHRATAIALLVGDSLAKQQLAQDVELESVAIRPERLTPNTADSEIAQIIVRQLVANLGGSA